MLKRLLSILLIFLLADLYFYQAVITLTGEPLIRVFYWLPDGLLLGAMTFIIVMRRVSPDAQRWIAILMSAVLLIFIPKLVAAPVLLAEDIVRLFEGFPPRSVYVSEAAVVLAGLMFCVTVFGLTRGKHFYKVRRETLYFPDLPEAFDNFTITQLSDVHSGSFSDARGVRKGLDLVNDQDSDLLLFTGDLVNHRAAEMDPWIEDFTRLKAPYGKYSVLGNHDYGDYIRWESGDAKEANMVRLKEVHTEIGFTLLLNQAVTISKHGQTVALIGVENWGKGGFHKYGDLKKATVAVPDNAFKILLSHDPSHWDEVTLDHHQHVHLTLAGHTHGMQFGMELFGFKWSPIKYVYKQWAGLYEQDGKYLYVNRGFGYHGLKGRIGMWPEITVLTLKKGSEPA